MNNSCKIVSIEASPEEVRIDFRYTNYYGYGGWVRIDEDCFIRPTGSDLHFKMNKSDGMPISPKTLDFKKTGDVLYYTLYFPPLPEDITEIDIIEDEEDSNSFNFFSIPLKQNNMMMTSNKVAVLKKIEQVALELKGNNKETKSYFQEIERLDNYLSELSEFFKLSKNESAVFCLALYISITTDSFSVTEIKRYTNFSPFDFYEIKNIVRTLLKKGWIVKCGSVGMHRGNRRMEEKVFNVVPSVLDSLYKDKSPELKKKELDVYLTSDILHKCLREHCDDEIESEEMHLIIAEYEEEYPDINPFKIANELKLNHNEKLLLYYLVTKTSIGEDTVDVDRMVSHLFKEHFERILVKKMLSKRDSILFKDKYIEFVKEDFRTDKLLKMSVDGVKKVFGEDACFLSKEDDFSSGICKLIKHENIVEKELFYNETEQQSITTLAEFLVPEKYINIVARLEENKMRSGLTILLHGYPGTGKTETIYQLARQTKRNILLVNISEIRDKWVGESEKRLKAVFETYKNSFKHFEQMPILLFNESDALIGKRINVNTSVDQMNNAMQNILLQELEDFNGILMATTNLTSNLDDAFERRFLFKIKYSRPSHKAKASIWKSKLNFLSENDAQNLAAEFDFSGGQIENISRKIFLDSVLLGKTYTLEDTIQYCKDEKLGNDRNKIGY